MKKIFNFAKKKKHASGTPDSGSVLSVGYELKDKDLGKVHKAAAAGDVGKLKQLAKKNDINQLDKENRTALHIACASGHVEVVQFLVEAKAKLNLCDNQNRSALMKAVQCQHERCVSILLENHAEPNLVDINGNTALHLAANIPSISTAVLLLEHEADINAHNKEAFTPLAVAVREDHIEMAEFLLKEGADVNCVDQDQRSLLMIAAGNGHIGMLRLLLQFEADIALKDIKGWSADDYAVMNGHHPCSLLIIEHSTQKNNGQQLSPQGLSKKKKKTLLSSSSQDAEASFSLGGPATDKYDFEDNSQSESLSRVSKSAADEWPSSEDDESVSIVKKSQKVNLRKMIAFKRGEASVLPDRSLSGTESEPESESRVQRTPSLPKAFESSKAPHHSVDPSPISFPSRASKMTSSPLPNYRQPSRSKAKSDSREGSPEAEDSEEEVEDEDEEEEEEDDDNEGEEEEEEEGEEEEEEGEEEEEEEEEEEGEVEEDEDEENEEEDEEENESEEDDDNCVAPVETTTTLFEDVLKTVSADPQKVLCTDISPNSETSPCILGEREQDNQSKTQQNNTDYPAGTNDAVPVTLGLENDCVVSAIRVESKFSDEDESLGKECVWSQEQNNILGSTGGPTLSRPHLETSSPTEVKEEAFERETEKDDDDSWSNNQNSGNAMSKDTEDEEVHQIGEFDHVLANQRNVPEYNVENKVGSSDAEDDAESHREACKDGTRRSSWGSSIEDSDGDLPEEEEVDKKNVYTSDLKPATLHSKFTLIQQNAPVESLGLCSTGTPQSKNSPEKVIVNESEWDSSATNDQTDICSFDKDSKTNIVTVNQPGEQHFSDNFCEEISSASLEKESDDPSPAVSPEHEDKNPTRNPSQDDSDSNIESIGQPSQTEGKLDMENEKGDDYDSWDDEDKSCESERQKATGEGDIWKTSSTPTNLLSQKSRPSIAMDKKSKEVSAVDKIKENEYSENVFQSVDGSDENRMEEDKLVGVYKYSLGKDENDDDDASEDSDSKEQKLQYDFASATVKVGEDSDDTIEGCLCAGNSAKLIAYVPLENRTPVVVQQEVSSGDLSGEPRRDKTLSGTPTAADVTTGHNCASEGDLSGDALPQTDIDDVDLESPDEAENIGRASKEKGHSTEDEEEEDISVENKQPEEIRKPLHANLTATETKVSKDKKRDFLSELGLEKGEEEPDSWDSESYSENPNMPQAKMQSFHTQDQEGIKERSTSNDHKSKLVDKGYTQQKETEKTKWGPLSVLSKLEDDKNRKSDVMEELGLGGDDLEDASDWDSASTTSKKILPGRRLASPGPEFPECSHHSVKKQDEDDTPTAPQTPQRSIKSPQPAPYPQPRARKMVPQKPESEEESDWDPDNSKSSSKSAEIDTQQQNIARALVGRGSPELSPTTRGSQSNVVSDKQQQKDKDDAVVTCKLDLDKPRPSGHVISDREEKDNDCRDGSSPEGGGEASDDVPWEKRYEKLWVEVEKQEVKSNFKNVAGELKEKFGELHESKCPANDLEEQAESTSAEEESSDEEGQVIVRPTARARNTILLTVPGHRESGLEDSLTESVDKSVCEDRMQGCESSMCREPDLLTDEACRSASPQFKAQRDGGIDHISTTLSSEHPTAQDEAKFEPKHLEHIWKHNPTNLYEVEKNCANLEEDPEEVAKSHRPSLQRISASVPGFSDEELEEDMDRFKLEVGMLKVVFLDLEKEKAELQKEVCKERARIAVEVKKISTSWYSGGTTVEEVRTEKPETQLGCLSNPAAAVHPKRQPMATKSTNRAQVHFHLPHQQTYNSNKQERQAAQKLELVRGAQHSRAPQTNTHVNGDPLSVFDDSTLSEVSDDEGRLPAGEKQKNENPEEVEMAEDFDELTQSSDTATDDIDSPTSGYRHASLLIQKLDSATLDSKSMVKLQNIFHEYERSIQKARSRHSYLTDKVSQLEMERAEMKSSLEEVKDVKSGLERNQLEMQTEVTNLKFQLKQEQENRRNTTMMYNTTRDKLRRTEEQQQFEVQERQKVELTLRNLELEMRTMANNMKQLEEDHSETQRLLAQERSARTLQENLLNSHLRKQQDIEEQNKRNITKSNEALSQLTGASDRERELLQQIASLQEQLTILRTDLEHSKADSSLRESSILEENEVFKEKLEDIRRDLKLNGEALTQTIFNCNNQVTTLKSELAITTTRLDNERQTRETLETEVESIRTRLAGAVKEAELCLAAHSETERALFREKEEHQRLKDRLTGEATNQREVINSLSQKLAKAEAHANSMENEVHRVTLQLTEKGLLLEVLQREKDHSASHVKELEMTLHKERDQVNRAGARQEAAQERLAQAQSEGMLLRQQLEEAQNKGVAKERAVTDAQERFSDILCKLRSDCEERVQLVEERNKELAAKAVDLRDQIYKLEEEKNERETSLRQLQQELADSLKKLSMSEASLEVNTRYRNDLEEEKSRLLKDLDRLKGKLEESEEQYMQAERRINSLKSILDEKEKELSTAAQKLQEALSASAAHDTVIKQLEEAVQRLEIENARLEATAKHQSNKMETLQKGAQEAAMVRAHLEDLVTNLQSSKMTLEEQLSREVQKQSTLSHTAQDSQALWEEELKSRSKLGIRLAELEKEKGELSTQMEIEKKKAKKIAEQKKAVDNRLDQEMKRNTELQKEMYRLRTLLKTAKKKLHPQDVGRTEFGSPMSSLRMDLDRHSQAEGAFGRMKDKVDDLQMQLEREVSRRSQLEKVNGELKDKLVSLKSLSRSTDHLERSKKELEEEVLELKHRVEASQMEQSQVEHYRRDAEEKARQEVQQKLEQVNLFLQTQAASQEALDQIKAANEANLRSQFEQKIREMEGELGRARTTQHESLNQRDSTRMELDRYKQLYGEEVRLRKSLSAKLERANSRLAEANSKLLNERSRSLMASSIANSSLGGPSLDLGTLGSPAHYGSTLGPLNRSLGLGLSLLSPVTEGQNSRVEDYLAKMQSELDRNIAKELSNATAELDIASSRLSPVGSSSRAERDPISRATQQYLEVLKKNNMI